MPNQRVIGTGSESGFGTRDQYMVNYEAVGGVTLGEYGSFLSLPVYTGSSDIDSNTAVGLRQAVLSKSFTSSSGSIIQALNYLKGLVSNADDLTWAEFVTVAATADSPIDFNDQNFTGVGTIGCGAVTSTGAGSFAGTLDCDTSFTLDSVEINATELGYIDSVTAGTAAASKAVVLNADKTVTGVKGLTAIGITGSEGLNGGSVTSGGTLTVATTSQLGAQVNDGGLTKISSSNDDFALGTVNVISQATFAKIPGLSIQGVKSDGKMADFKIQVSGGILMAVAQ